jgi:MFS family permease
VLTLCCLIAAICALDRVVMSIAILPMGDEFGYEDGTKGLVAAAFSVGYGLALIPVGAAASTRGPRPVLALGLLWWSVAQLATPAAAAAGVPWLLGARAGMGVGEAAAIPSLQAVAAERVPEAQRSRFWGVLTSCLSLGTIAAYTATPAIIDAFDWEASFSIYGLAGVGLAAAWWAAPYNTATATTTGSTSKLSSSSSTDGGIPWQTIRCSSQFWALLIAHACSNWFLYFSLSYLPTYFNYQFGMDASQASSASMEPFVAGALCSLASGLLCDWLVDSGQASLTRARKLMQTVSFLGPASCMVALAALESFSPELLSRENAEDLFILAVGCQSFSAAGFGCAAQDASKQYAGVIYGASSAAAVAAGALSQASTGWLLEANGRDFEPIFLLTALILSGGCAAFWAKWSSEGDFDERAREELASGTLSR